MKKSLAALLAAAVAAAAGSALAGGPPPNTFSLAFNFDSLPSGSLASLFSTSQVSFHNAKFTPTLDGFGDPIVGTDHWQIDTASDTAFPLLVQNPNLFGRGNAPSPANALNGLDQEILVQFDHPYLLTSFSVTLDNDTFGLSTAQISFVTGTSTVLSVGADQTVAGFVVNQGPLATPISGIVLPGGAFYDNIAVAATVPEPSTWSALAGVAALGLAALRRRRASAF